MVCCFRFGALLLRLGLLGAIGGLLWSGCAEPRRSASASADSTTASSATAPSAATASAPGVPHRAAPPPEKAFRIQSVTLDARRRPEAALLDSIQALGTTHLTLIPFGTQRRPDDPTVALRPNPGWYSESEGGIRALAAAAEERGMGVILKPHVWVGHYDVEGQARDEIGFDTAADWAQWEASYRRFMLYYARLAADINAEVLVVGTELHRAAASREAFWRGLIADVRGVYGGALTYAANWYAEYEAVPFWDALDYVGIQAYFPLSDADDPPLDALRQGWHRHREALDATHRATERPILFTEVGYRSIHYAAAEPWRWPQRSERQTPADPALQARCYTAFFQMFADVPWFAGAVLWKWHPLAESRRRVSFTPQHKPAEQVVRRWFGGRSRP